jgi:hypothetical protein
MLKSCPAWIVAAWCLLAAALPVRGAGWLWLTSEFAGEGNVYRFNLDTGMVDLIISPPLPAEAMHWNNAATDGTYLYLGSPTTQYFGVFDIMTGGSETAVEYSPALAGHKEDGAYRRSSDTLWRITFSGAALYETTKTGTLVNTFNGTSGLVGLEWVGPDLYATNFTDKSIGRIVFNGSAITYEAIPWAADPGPPLGENAAGLAYDARDGVLYMQTILPARLYRVEFVGNEAAATLVATLGDVGYPAGGLADGMGWVPPPHCAGDADGDGDVDFADITSVLTNFGGTGPEGDADDDGDVEFADITSVLTNFGLECG